MIPYGRPGNSRRKGGTKTTVAKYRERTDKGATTLYFVKAALNNTGTGDWYHQ